MSIESPDAKHSRSSPQEPLREGDSGLGIPRSRVEGARPLSDEENTEIERRRDQELRRELEEKLEQLGLEPFGSAGESFHLPAGVVHVIMWIGLVVTTVLGLVLVGQGAALYGDIRTLPTPFDWIAGLTAVFFAVILVWLMLKLGMMLRRLHRSPTVNLRSIEALNQRQRWQSLAVEHTNEARRELTNYLTEYEVDGDARRRLRGLGFTEGQCEDLAKARQSLLDDDEPISAIDWLGRFRGRFQRILDKAAEKRTTKYASNVGWSTAATPFAVIDKAIVLYSCMALIKELMSIYGLRPTFGQTTTILARSILQTYLSGELQEVSERGTDTVWDEIAEKGSEMIGTTVGDLAGQILPKLAEGGINGVLIWRLGKRAISLLQPVRSEG